MKRIVTTSLLIAAGITVSACNVTTSGITRGDDSSDGSPTFIAAHDATVTVTTKRKPAIRSRSSTRRPRPIQ